MPYCPQSTHRELIKIQNTSFLCSSSSGSIVWWLKAWTLRSFGSNSRPLTMPWASVFLSVKWGTIKYLPLRFVMTIRWVYIDKRAWCHMTIWQIKQCGPSCSEQKSKSSLLLPLIHSIVANLARLFWKVELNSEHTKPAPTSVCHTKYMHGSFPQFLSGFSSKPTLSMKFLLNINKIATLFSDTLSPYYPALFFFILLITF